MQRRLGGMHYPRLLCPDCFAASRATCSPLPTQHCCASAHLALLCRSLVSVAHRTGTLSYVVTEIAFWAFALPAAYFGYHQATGGCGRKGRLGIKAKRDFSQRPPNNTISVLQGRGKVEERVSAGLSAAFSSYRQATGGRASSASHAGTPHLLPAAAEGSRQ